MPGKREGDEVIAVEWWRRGGSKAQRGGVEGEVITVLGKRETGRKGERGGRKTKERERSGGGKVGIREGGKVTPLRREERRSNQRFV